MNKISILKEILFNENCYKRYQTNYLCNKHPTVASL